VKDSTTLHPKPEMQHNTPLPSYRVNRFADHWGS